MYVRMHKNNFIWTTNKIRDVKFGCLAILSSNENYDGNENKSKWRKKILKVNRTGDERVK